MTGPIALRVIPRGVRASIKSRGQWSESSRLEAKEGARPSGVAEPQMQRQYVAFVTLLEKWRGASCPR